MAGAPPTGVAGAVPSAPACICARIASMSADVVMTTAGTNAAPPLRLVGTHKAALPHTRHAFVLFWVVFTTTYFAWLLFAHSGCSGLFRTAQPRNTVLECSEQPPISVLGNLGSQYCTLEYAHSK